MIKRFLTYSFTTNVWILFFFAVGKILWCIALEKWIECLKLISYLAIGCALTYFEVFETIIFSYSKIGKNKDEKNSKTFAGVIHRVV